LPPLAPVAPRPGLPAGGVDHPVWAAGRLCRAGSVAAEPATISQPGCPGPPQQRPRAAGPHLPSRSRSRRLSTACRLPLAGSCLLYAWTTSCGARRVAVSARISSNHIRCTDFPRASESQWDPPQAPACAGAQQKGHEHVSSEDAVRRRGRGRSGRRAGLPQPRTGRNRAAGVRGLRQVRRRPPRQGRQ